MRVTYLICQLIIIFERFAPYMPPIWGVRGNINLLSNIQFLIYPPGNRLVPEFYFGVEKTEKKNLLSAIETAFSNLV